MYKCQTLTNVLCRFIPWNEPLTVAVPHAPNLEVHLHLTATKRRLFLAFFALLAAAKMCLTSESTVKNITVTRQMTIKMITVRFSKTSNVRKHDQSRGCLLAFSPFVFLSFLNMFSYYFFPWASVFDINLRIFFVFLRFVCLAFFLMLCSSS